MAYFYNGRQVGIPLAINHRVGGDSAHCVTER
jgi:hypothetical protein